jgi:alpha-tubulin suppressor-like RCC1 family protein
MTYEDGVEFTDLSVGDNFVMAIDSTGKLWGWGVNKNNALGFKEIDDQGIQQPTLLTGLNDLGMIAKKISCGPNHSLILFEDKKVASFGKEFLYSVGLTKGKDFAHLGAPEDQTKDAEQPFREIKEFNEKKLVSFLAHDTASLVIIEGKKEIYEGLYAHTLPDKR